MRSMVVERVARRPRRVLAALVRRVEARSETRLRAAETRLAARLDAALAPVSRGLADLAPVPARLDALAERLAETERRSQHAASAPHPAVAAWEAVAESRREGACVLVLTDEDARAVRGAASGPLPFAVHALDAPAARRAPLPAGHAIGALVVDLDRLDAAAVEALAAEAAWLRADVPVVGLSAEAAAETLPVSAAVLARAVGGALLPRSDTAGLVRFAPGLAPGGLDDVPAPEPARRRIGAPALPEEVRP